MYRVFNCGVGMVLVVSSDESIDVIKHLEAQGEKAFDTVWRDGLWYKLLMCNIKGKMYNVILNPMISTLYRGTYL
jgi:hypothetical protein